MYVSGVGGCMRCLLSSAEQNKTEQQQQGVDPEEERERGLEPAGLNQLQSHEQVLPISHPLQPATHRTQPHTLHTGHNHTHYTQDTTTHTTHRTGTEGRNIIDR